MAPPTAWKASILFPNAVVAAAMAAEASTTMLEWPNEK